MKKSSPMESPTSLHSEADNHGSISKPWNTIPERPMTPLLPPMPEMRPESSNNAGNEFGQNDLEMMPLTPKPSQLIQSQALRTDSTTSSRSVVANVRNVMQSIPEELEEQEEPNQTNTISNIIYEHGETVPTRSRSRSLDSVTTSITDIYTRALSMDYPPHTRDTAVEAGIRGAQGPQAGLERRAMFSRLPFDLIDLPRGELKQRTRSGPYIERGSLHTASGRELSPLKVLSEAKDSLKRRYCESVQKLSPRRSISVVHNNSVDDLLPLTPITASQAKTGGRNKKSVREIQNFAKNLRNVDAESQGGHRCLGDAKSLHSTGSNNAEKDWETILDAEQSSPTTVIQSLGAGSQSKPLESEAKEYLSLGTPSLSIQSPLKTSKARRNLRSYFQNTQTETRPERSIQATRRQNETRDHIETQQSIAAWSPKLSVDPSPSSLSTTNSQASSLQKDPLFQDLQDSSVPITNSNTSRLPKSVRLQRDLLLQNILDSPALQSSSLFPEAIITTTDNSSESNQSGSDILTMDKGKGKAREWDPTDPSSSAYRDAQPEDQLDDYPELNYEDMFEDIEDSSDDNSKPLHQRSRQIKTHEKLLGGEVDTAHSTSVDVKTSTPNQSSSQHRLSSRYEKAVIDIVRSLDPENDTHVSNILIITKPRGSRSVKKVEVKKVGERTPDKAFVEAQHRAGRIAVLLGSLFFPWGGFVLLKNMYEDRGDASDMMMFLSGNEAINRAHEDERRLAGLILILLGVPCALVGLSCIIFTIWLFARWY